MIIQALLDGIYNLMSTLLLLDIPDLPPEINGYIDMAFDYIVAGAGVFANYAPLDYLMTLFGVLLSIDAGILLYHLIMWIIRKIPVAGVS